MNAAVLQGVEVLSPAPREVWACLAATDPSAFPTQLPEWGDALRAARRGTTDASRLYRLPDGRELVLPLAGRAVGGLRVAEESWPYGWGYGGLLAGGGRVTAADTAVVLADLARRPVLRASVVPVPTAAEAWELSAPRTAARVPYLTQVVDLDGGFERVWSSRYKKSTRNYIRKAERMPLEVRRQTGGAVVDTFTEMYARSRQRWAEQRGQPRRVAALWARYQDRGGQVRAVSEALGDRCVIWSAWRDAEPVAVLIVLHHGAHALSWLTALERTLADDTLATYRLQSLAIEDACRLGVRHFHLGETDPGSGVERYKAKYGAVPLRYEALRLERLPLTHTERTARRLAQAALARQARRTTPVLSDPTT